MADMTLIGGQVIQFDAAVVAALADHGPDAGETITLVYGLSPGVLETREAAEHLLARVGVAGRFARLTRPDGSRVWISGGAVISIAPPLPDLYPPNAKTVITTAALVQAVVETPAAVRIALDAKGGKL
jgi:hypothetical protein